MASFPLGPQWGRSTYDYTQTLTEPQSICTEAELAEKHETEEEAGGSRYFTFLNSLYVSRDGKTSRLASTPFYRTFFHSPFLAFGTGLVSLFVMPLLTARLAERLEITFSAFSAISKRRKRDV